MKQYLLAGAMMIAAESCAFAQSGFWVVGDSAAGKCEIVTSNPVINSQVGGNITFGSGPYQSMDDAKLARSNISECPAVPEPPAEQAPEEEKSD
ncbi:MAG TPA: hypothetical protein VFX76_03065 [Roseiflexaceae bacterium]|jgi:hypothetical protein|nr:hypothetical protein [Roseiflexaceae bacterium]